MLQLQVTLRSVGDSFGNVKINVVVCFINVLLKKSRCTWICIYPAMTAFTDQYSLPNIFWDIGQL